MEKLFIVVVTILLINSCKPSQISKTKSFNNLNGMKYCQPMKSSSASGTEFKANYQLIYNRANSDVKAELEARETVTRTLVAAYSDFKRSIVSDINGNVDSNWEITDDNFKRWATILQSMQKRSFEEGAKVLELDHLSQNKKNQYLSRFAYLTTHMLVSSWVTANSLGYIAHEIGHLNTAEHFGATTYVGDILSKKRLSMYDLYIRLMKGKYFDQAAWHWGLKTAEAKAATAGAGINVNTQAAEDCFLNLVRGDSKVAKLPHCMLNKFWGVKYFYQDQAGQMGDEADPHQYIDYLNQQGLDTQIEDVTLLLAATSLLSGSTLSYLNGVIQFVSTGRFDVTPLHFKIGKVKVTLPELSTYLNSNHVSTKVLGGIELHQYLLLTLASELSVYGKKLPADFYVEVDFQKGDYTYNLNLNRAGSGELGGGGSISYDTATGKFSIAAKYHSGTTRADKRNLDSRGMEYTVGFSKGNMVGELALSPNGELSEAFYLNLGGELDFCNPEFLYQNFGNWGIPSAYLLEMGDKLAGLAHKGILTSFRYRLLAGLRNNKNISTQALMSLGIHTTLVEGSKVLQIPSGLLPKGMLTTNDQGIITDYSLGGSLTLDQLKSAHFSPEFIVKSYIMGLKTSIQVAISITEADVQIRFGQGPMGLILGANASTEGISPEIGGSIKEKSGLGSSLVIAPLTLGFILMDKESMIYGDNESGISCKLGVGCRTISRKNPGHKWIMFDGTVFAEKQIHRGDGLLSLFQYNDKPVEVKQEIEKVYHILNLLLQNNRSLFFKQSFLKEIAELDHLKEWATFLFNLETTFIEVMESDFNLNFRAINFASLYGEKGVGFSKMGENTFDPSTGILTISDITAPLPDLYQQTSKSATAIIVSQIQSKAVKNLLEELNDDGFGLRVVIEDKTLPLTDKAEKGLEKLLFYMKHYLTKEQFHNRLLYIEHARDLRALVEFIGFSRFHSKQGSALIQISDYLLEDLSNYHLGELIYDAKLIPVEQGDKVALFMEYIEKANINHIGMERVVFLSNSEFIKKAISVDADYYQKMNHDREKHFIRQGTLLYVNIDRVEELHGEGGIFGKGNHARSHLQLMLRPERIRNDVFNFFPFLNLLSEEGKRLRILKEASGQSEFLLTQFLPENLLPAVFHADGSISFTYKMRDAYHQPIQIKKQGITYQDSFEILIHSDFSTVEVTLKEVNGKSHSFSLINQTDFNKLFKINGGIALMAVKLFMETGPRVGNQSNEVELEKALSLYNQQNRTNQILLNYQQQALKINNGNK